MERISCPNALSVYLTYKDIHALMEVSSSCHKLFISIWFCNVTIKKAKVPCIPPQLWDYVRNVNNWTNKVKYLRNLTSIVCNDDFAQPLEPDFLPISLKSLTLGANFNQKLEMLPSNLSELHLGYLYNHDLTSCMLPKTLLSLTFSVRFNKRLKPNVLPASLTFLDLGYCYNHKLTKDVLPPNLKVLLLSGFTTHRLEENTLPDSLEVLGLGIDYKFMLHRNILPKTLDRLIIFHEQIALVDESIRESSIRMQYWK